MLIPVIMCNVSHEFFLSHCAEGQGEHYVALWEELDDHIDYFSVQNNFARSKAKADESATYKSPEWRNFLHAIWEIIFKMIFHSCFFKWSHYIYSVFNPLYDTCEKLSLLRKNINVLLNLCF